MYAKMNEQCVAVGVGCLDRIVRVDVMMVKWEKYAWSRAHVDYTVTWWCAVAKCNGEMEKRGVSGGVVDLQEKQTKVKRRRVRSKGYYERTHPFLNSFLPNRPRRVVLSGCGGCCCCCCCCCAW